MYLHLHLKWLSLSSFPLETPVFVFVWQVFVKNAYNEFHKNSKECLFADTRARMVKLT
jgi:hypothetical protein